MTPREMLHAEMRKADHSATADQLDEMLVGWELHPFYDGDELQGVAVTKGTEFHCHIADGFKLNRSVMRGFMRPLFERHGFLTTRVSHEDIANQRFNRVFGFEQTWSDDRFIYYILTELPFERRASCPQSRS